MSTVKRTGSNPVTVGDKVHPQEVARLQRLARELRLTDQMLSWDIDSVAVVEHGPAPAWTNVDTGAVTINVSSMPKLYTRQDVAVWLGTNGHELFHDHYTPRSDTMLVRRLLSARALSPTVWRAFNVLEDQRIERLGIARYRKWRGYLIAALRHHIDPTHPGAWLLLTGRTWLPAETRAIARAMFVATYGEQAADLAAHLVGSYQRLTDPALADADEAYRIIVEFDEAFRQATPPSTCQDRQAVKGDADDSEVGETVDVPTADDPEPDDTTDGDTDGDESGDGDTDDGEGDDADEGDGDGSGKGDADGDGDEGDPDDDDEAEGGGGIGRPTDKPRTLRESLRDDVNDALDDADTADDLDRVVDQVENGTPGRAIDCPRAVGSYLDVGPAARRLARDVTDVLVDIKDDCEAAWERRVDSGRFSVERWATDPGWEPDTAFDLFDPGAMDASSLDVTLLIDISGSMSSATRATAEATWAIRTAIDRVEGECTVLGFGDDAVLMFPPTQRPDGRVFIPQLHGSTHPSPALRIAHQMVLASAATNRLVVILTDGEWYRMDAAKASIAGCREAGATVVVLGLGNYCQHVKEGFAGADIAERIDDPAQMVDVFRRTAERSMRQAAGMPV